MLETPTAIANAAEIAAVPGVDVLLIGTNDLCAEMGIHGDFGNERVAEAYRTMIAGARKHGKFPGMAGIYNETIMPRYIEWVRDLSCPVRTPPSWRRVRRNAPAFCASSRSAAG